ncbi:MAG: phosphoglucomutase/phosphomannomutase PgmG [Rhodospirillales bacterium]
MNASGGAGARALDPAILREYDIRGVVDENLGPDDVRAIGRAFGSTLIEAGAKTAATAYDGRLSSPALEAALAEGLAASGLHVLRTGLGPTPMLYYAQAAIPADAGVMVTGSHNPPEYNGLKLVHAGKPVWGPQIKALGARAAAGDFVSGAGSLRDHRVFDDYVARLARDYKPGRDLRVGWDPGNGAAGEAAQRLTAQLPGEHHLINADIDGTFPAHHPDPTVEENLAQLKALVAEKKLDIGVAFDGDGDRIGVIDGQGRVLWGDQILIVLAREVLARHPGAKIIADVKTSQAFFDEITRMGGEPVMWKTGHSLIKNKMRETGAPLAGEMSAHIFFADGYYGFDDALYAAVRLLSVLAHETRSLAEMRDALPVFINTPELRFNCAEDRKFDVMEEVRKRLAAGAGADAGVRVQNMDGVRVENEDGWWLLRASNTQAVLVARCESRTEAGLARLKAALAEHLAASGVELPKG